MNENIGAVTLDYSDYPGQDFYSDGAIEDEILEIVKNNVASAYNRIIAEKNQWPILYHLSRTRENIVDWIPMKKTDHVLEVGSGCGAITGALARKAGSVTCIELSKKRSLINAYRNKQYDNIEIKVGNFEDIEKKLEGKYEYITLIGVFEYGESYISMENPYENFLKLLGMHLKENGKIIIAIENKYGMKYWAGCKEDHVSKFYEGIEGYPTSTGVKTFSRKELEGMFSRSGFNKWDFYYPYPDYKLPCTIYSDEYQPKVGELTNNLRNFDGQRLVLFDEAKAFDGIINEGLFSFYSNSFLVMLGK